MKELCLTHKVIFKRTRIIEEKIIVRASAADPADAVAASKHLLEGQQVDWKYNRTLGTSETSVEVTQDNPTK